MSVAAAIERWIRSSEGRQPPGKISWLEKLAALFSA
jgi:hypothetical protein